MSDLHAGPRSSRGHPTGTSDDTDRRLREREATIRSLESRLDQQRAQLRELMALRETVIRQQRHLETLTAHRDELARQQTELVEQLVSVHEQVWRRDDDLRRRHRGEVELMNEIQDRGRVIAARDEGIAWLQAEAVRLRQAIAERDNGIAWLRAELASAPRRGAT